MLAPRSGDFRKSYHSEALTASRLARYGCRWRMINSTIQPVRRSIVSSDGIAGVHADPGVGRLRALLDITRALTAETSQDRLLGLIVDSAARLLGAERCSLYLVDLERGELWTKAAHLP